MPSQPQAERSFFRTSRFRLALLLAGLIATQFYLYGPSLLGRRILLPLDFLAKPHVYPIANAPPNLKPQTRALSDLVFQLDPFQQLTVSEVRAGRWPLWNPYIYCGAPLLAAGQSSVFSPFSLLRYAWPSPYALAWIQLLRSVFAGLGAFLFFRKSLRVTDWAAFVPAMVFPVSGFLILGPGYPSCETLVWLPWLLLCTDLAVRRPAGWGGLGLAVCVAGTISAGHLAMAASVFLLPLGWLVWTMVRRHGLIRLLSRAALAGWASALAGWAVGLAMSMPQALPAMEYALSGSLRALNRATGDVNFPPLGLKALPLIAVPDFYGTIRTDFVWLLSGTNQLESPASGYAGLLMLLGVAPLAWLSRRHIGRALFFLAAGFFCLAQPLGVPVLDRLFALPPFNLLQNNRLVFCTGFATLALAAIGLEGVRRNVRWEPQGRVVGGLAAAAAMVLAAVCLHRIWVPPERISTICTMEIMANTLAAPKAAAVEHAQSILRRFGAINMRAASLCFLSIAWWGLAILRPAARRPAAIALAIAAAIEVLVAARGISPQTPMELYYPRAHIFDQLQSRPPGRICAVGCLPANLGMPLGLRDIRGYDAMDPLNYVELLDLCRHPRSQPLSYTLLQDFFPVNVARPDKMSSILHMLNLRYLIFPDSAAIKTPTALEGNGYRIIENPAVLPRAFVPKRVAVVPDRNERLQRLVDPEFNAALCSYVENSIRTFDPNASAAGRAVIIDEIPTRVRLVADMQTAGLVVLADLWYPGWKAFLNGSEQPVHRANHALRGVEVPAGRSTLEFSYQPASFAWGLRLSAAAATGGLLWAGLIIIPQQVRRRHRISPSRQKTCRHPAWWRNRSPRG